jgi:hypothetical protein
VGAEAFNQGCFLSGRQHGVCYSSCLLSPLFSVYSEIITNERFASFVCTTGTQKQTRPVHRAPNHSCSAGLLCVAPASWPGSPRTGLRPWGG